jgi:hypothetical protein
MRTTASISQRGIVLSAMTITLEVISQLLIAGLRSSSHSDRSVSSASGRTGYSDTDVQLSVSNNKVIEYALKPYPVSDAELRGHTSCLTQKIGDTMDTAFCGNWLPRGESIDNRENQRLQGNSLVSASCDRSTVNSETWRTAEASLRIPPPRPSFSMTYN